MDALEIFDCEQGGPEWFACRLGLPTASEFDTVLAKGKGGGPSLIRRKYLYQLAGQIITGEMVAAWEGNQHTERGKEQEGDAKAMYAFMKDAEVAPVGFMRRGRCGASPDGLIGSDGLLEIKTKLPHLQIEVLMSGQIPPEHKAQIQGQLMVSGREWLDFVSYWRGLPLFVQRVHADHVYQTDLKRAIAEFNDELDDLVSKLRAMA